MLYMYMYYLYLLSLMVWVFGIYLFYLDQSFMFEWLLVSVLNLSLVMLVYLDWVSLIFVSIMMFISFMVLVYSMSYMKKDKKLKQFMYLMYLFILSMFMLIISPNLVSMMFGWDGLGLVSYLLVIYYQNYMSYYSGMVTVLMNRMGDIMLLMVISLMLCYGGWHLFYIKKLSIVMLFVVGAAMTKSAQFPFSTWLPLAMAAPTPVSALVHSSTLVVAGVYLLIRCWEVLFIGKSGILLWISIFTMFMAGMMASFENDLKKIIALSTLSQMGLMMMSLSLSFTMLAFYHLLIHAIFKSLMFLSVGVIIHMSSNNQDIRLMGNMFEYIPFSMINLLISILSLCGIPFMAGFYSKDLIIEEVYVSKLNFFVIVLIIMSLMLTVFYSVRLLIFFFMKGLKVKLMSYKEDYLMNISMVGLLMMSVFMGSLLNWVFFLEMIFLKISFKLMTLGIVLLGIIISMMGASMELIKLYWLGYFFSSMMFYNIIIMKICEKLMWVVGELNQYSVIWFEYYSEKFFVMFMSYSDYLMTLKYKIYLYLMMIVWFIVLILIST